MGKLFPDLQPREALCERLRQPVLHTPGSSTQRGHEKVVESVALPAVEKVFKVRKPRVRRRREQTWTVSTRSSWRRPLSPFSLREAAYTKETLGIGVYRQIVEDEVAQREDELAAFAWHRMDCQRQARCFEREQAALWRKRREAREPLHQVRWLLLPLVEKRPVSPALLGPLPLLEAGSGPASRAPTPESQEEPAPAPLFNDERTPLNHRVIQRLKSRPHNLGEERNWRLTLMRKRTQRDKARKAASLMPVGLGLVQDEVDVKDYLSSIKPSEAAAYEQILRQMCSNRKVDQADLQLVLSEMGFRPRTCEERKCLRGILGEIEHLEVDFDVVLYQLIPQLRQRYCELRQPELLELFRQADEDGSGALSVEELMAVLQRSGFYPQLREVCETLLEVIPNAKNHLNVEGQLLTNRVSISQSYFRVVGPLLQERAECLRLRREMHVAEELSLDAKEKRLWQDNLLDLWEAFQRFSDGTHLQVQRLPLLVLDTQLYPKQCSVQPLLNSLAAAELARAGGEQLDLRQCVKILSKIREKECERLLDSFQRMDSDGSNGLSLEECRKCLDECRVCSEQEDSDFIIALIEEYDLDESGELEREEFTRMVKFVSSRLRRRRLRRLADVSLGYGWPEEEFEQIRGFFLEADLEMDGRIRDDQIALTLEKLRNDWPAEDTNGILREMGFGSFSTGFSVDLGQFLQLLHFVDLRLRHRQIGSILGLDSEAVENFCSVWWSMRPEHDTVAISSLVDVIHQLPGYHKKLAKLQEVMIEGAERINFQKYCLVMRRSAERTETTSLE